MKPIRSFIMVMLVVTMISATNRSIFSGDSAVVETFAATTPCGDLIKALHKISPENACDMVEWNLILFEDPATHKPNTYKIVSINHYVETPSNMYSQPGTKTESFGKWSILRGTKKDPEAIVYQLNSNDSKNSLRFVKISDNLIHLLDKDDQLMIGNAQFSYTLNKVKK